MDVSLLLRVDDVKHGFRPGSPYSMGHCQPTGETRHTSLRGTCIIPHLEFDEPAAATASSQGR